MTTCQTTAAVLVLAALFPIGCRRDTHQTIPSPDGTMILATSVNQSKADPTKYLCVRFEIRDDRTGAVIHRQQTSASDVMRWSIHWESNETIRLESSDVGTCWWDRQPNGSWKERQMKKEWP